MKKLSMLLALTLSTSVLAQAYDPLEFQVGSVSVEEVTEDQGLILKNGTVNGRITGGGTGGSTGGRPGKEPIPTDPNDPFPGGPFPSDPLPNDNIDRAGRIVGVARDIVAIGDALYELVTKGRPTNTTDFTPISILPRDPISKEIVDPFELEGFSMPTERNFVARVKNRRNREVVTFNYKVIYSYGGRLNGNGRYLTGIAVVPSSIRTSFGWDFNATMKVGSVMNHGTIANPIAGVLLTIKYQMNSWLVAFERNDSIHITGAGMVKNMSVD